MGAGGMVKAQLQLARLRLVTKDGTPQDECMRGAMAAVSSLVMANMIPAGKILEFRDADDPVAWLDQQLREEAELGGISRIDGRIAGNV